MTRLLEAIGRAVLRIFEEFGNFFSMLGRVAFWRVRPPYDVPELFRQMVRVGFDSIPVVLVTTLFTGMVLALQTFNGFARFHAENLVGSVVALSLTRELAPVLTALMVTGRVGSAMAAELGTMRVTEQIDALTSLATEPVQYLIVPRVTASVLMMPLLVIMGDAVGIYGGYFVAVQLLGANPVAYLDNSFQYLRVSDDVVSGVIKAAVFGLIFSLIACVRGYMTTGGAEGVGRSTTRAVVAGSLTVLVVDFFLTKLLYK
jgi:phospholipid/cholesterol/gamma-HCH transport system permease protein